MEIAAKVEFPVGSDCGPRGSDCGLVGTNCGLADTQHDSEAVSGAGRKQLRSFETFDEDGCLIVFERELIDEQGQITRIIIRGSGKSSTTRIMCGEIEARATERLVLVETPQASYSYQPFEGRWCSYYKDSRGKQESRSRHLKNSDALLDGPDGIRLVFSSGHLVDLIFTDERCKRKPSTDPDPVIRISR
jgi:hypothetical protein